MRKVILLLLVLFCNGVVFGQEKQKINTIEWDFKAKKFKNDSIIKQLKVNDVVQIIITNMPLDYSISKNVTFLNNHLELRGSFGDNIAFGKDDSVKKPNQDNKTNTAVSVNNEIKNREESFNNKATDTINKLIQNKSKKTELATLNKKREEILKINSDSLIKQLEIKIAEKFITESNNNKKALDDINWQTYLISIAQKNWKNQLKIRDEIISRLSYKIDSLSQAVVLKDSIIEILKPTKTHNFSPFKVENYDFTELNIEITDKSNKESPIQSTFNFNFKNKGGFKLDFSTGILATGLYSPSYKLYTTNNMTQIKEEANPTSKFNTGIALMAHAYSRTGNYINVGVGSGFSFNLNSQNLNYLLGASLLWGEEQRFITTLGVNVGKVKELTDYYKIDTDYATTVFSANAEVPTVDVLKASWFLSITYNLGIGNPSKTKKL